MRRVGFVLAVLVAALVAASCDTSQPSKGGSTSAEVQVEARALVQIFDCYDRFVDNGTQDVFDRIVCFPAPSDAGQLLESRPIPWSYSFRIIILRAGQTFPEILVSSVNDDGEFPDFGSTARFDTVVQPAPIKLDEPPFSFQNPRRLSQGHQDYFRAYVDTGSQIRPPLALPEVNILNVEPPSPGVSPRYAFELVSGDSIIVEAAKQTIGLGPPVFPEGIAPAPRIDARLFIAGAQTSPSAGTVESSTQDGAGFSFTYISD
jgi:hypothetical protein